MSNFLSPDETKLIIEQTTLSGGTSNTNRNSNYNDSHAESTSVSTNTNTENSTSKSTSFNQNNSISSSLNSSVSLNTSNSSSFDTSNSTSNNTSNSTSTANNTNFSQSDIQVATINAAASNYQADQGLAGVNLHEQAETYRLNLKLAFAGAKFEEVFPLVSGVAGAASGTVSSAPIGFSAFMKPSGLVMSGPVPGSASGSGGDYTVGGGMEMGYYSRTPMRDFGDLRMGGGDTKTGGIGFASGSSVADAVAATQLPFISTSGVLTPAQIQQQVNSASARSDTRTQSEIRRLIGDLSGRGFSTNSPILAALRVGLAGQNLKATLENATQIQLESAKLNADATFAGQKAVADQYNAQEQVLVSIAVNNTTRTVGVLKAVTEMVGNAL